MARLLPLVFLLSIACDGVADLSDPPTPIGRCLAVTDVDLDDAMPHWTHQDRDLGTVTLENECADARTFLVGGVDVSVYAPEASGSAVTLQPGERSVLLVRVPSGPSRSLDASVTVDEYDPVSMDWQAWELPIRAEIVVGYATLGSGSTEHRVWPGCGFDLRLSAVYHGDEPVEVTLDDLQPDDPSFTIDVLEDTPMPWQPTPSDPVLPLLLRWSGRAPAQARAQIPGPWPDLDPWTLSLEETEEDIFIRQLGDGTSPIELDRTPDLLAEVWVMVQRERTEAWSFDPARNAVVLDDPPAPGSARVEVFYHPACLEEGA